MEFKKCNNRIMPTILLIVGVLLVVCGMIFSSDATLFAQESSQMDSDKNGMDVHVFLPIINGGGDPGNGVTSTPTAISTSLITVTPTPTFDLTPRPVSPPGADPDVGEIIRPQNGNCPAGTHPVRLGGTWLQEWIEDDEGEIITGDGFQCVPRRDDSRCAMHRTWLADCGRWAGYLSM